MGFNNQLPLLRVLFAFVLGIVLQINFPYPTGWAIIVSAAGFLLAAFIWFNKKLNRNFRFRWIFGLLLLAAVFSFGNFYAQMRSDRQIPDHYMSVPQVNGYAGVITEQIHEKVKSFKCVCEIRYIKTEGGGWRKSSGKLLMYFKKSAAAANLRYGDMIYFVQPPQEINPPKNPEEFDYKEFLSFHNIFRQVYLKENSWIRISENEAFMLRSIAIDWRDRMVEIFKKAIKRKQEYSVASALILGYEDDIDAELINAFASAGALHVLSVSGMHVGIIFFAISRMLLWMNRKKILWHFKHSLLIILVWFYAMLTGFSPSVLRAASMLTFIIVGIWSKRDSGFGNSIIVSAFFLLMWNPFMITEVGFQLSYLAVFGIFYVHPYIFRLIEPPGWLMHKIWEITSVSLSAQLMTFPLGLLYFHQFPLLFWVSNLIVIPLATIIIYGGIFLLTASVFLKQLLLIAYPLYSLLFLLNQSVIFVDHIPSSFLSGISITVLETWLIYFIIGSIFLFFLRKKPSYLIAALSAWVIFSAGQVMEEYELANQKKLIVYSVKNHSAIDIIYGREHFFSADEELIRDQSSMMFHIKHNWWRLELNDYKLLNKECSHTDIIFIKDNFIQLDTTRIKILDYKLPWQMAEGTERIHLDYLIISGNHIHNAEHLLKLFSVKKIIIDSSYSYYRAEKISDQFRKLGIACHCVDRDGAYLVGL